MLFNNIYLFRAQRRTTIGCRWNFRWVADFHDYAATNLIFSKKKIAQISCDWLVVGTTCFSNGTKYMLSIRLGIEMWFRCIGINHELLCLTLKLLAIYISEFLSRGIFRIHWSRATFSHIICRQYAEFVAASRFLNYFYNLNILVYNFYHFYLFLSKVVIWTKLNYK